ncbi:guanylate kinase [Leucobacter chromiireducens]|uniref:Guanylate kinase n=1 Tax=Leucobacter chromiireducens subsp. chromiireducens TaxID=660067 RepID=A0ABS1SVQ5_9MICO|nr:guanylate kinase [Leucobacter chromiireducens]MBL3690996.1 guanylate kinase [Leucobacter chromiireducens subsp. chromiireducens]
MSNSTDPTARSMPAVDRVAANRAAIAARQARAELKRRLRNGELSPLRVLEQSRVPGSPAATLRITDFLLSFPAIGVVKAERVREQLDISERKRLGGLGALQRERLERFVRERTGAETATGRPPLTVLAGPTAVGKGTVAAYIREHYPEVRHSVSATTRDPRPGEVDGSHYIFVDDEGFDRMLASDELLEWATVHNKHRYGTPRGPVDEAAARGELMLLEIDLQGARQVRASMPEARLVFLAPPSWDELVHRLVGRGTEDEEERTRRLETAKIELAAADEFDEIIVNDEVPRAAARLLDVMRGGERDLELNGA